MQSTITEKEKLRQVLRKKRFLFYWQMWFTDSCSYEDQTDKVKVMIGSTF